MSLTLTYDQQLSRVRAAMTGLEDTAVYHMDRSTDQIRWQVVRGGTALIPQLGVVNLDDYEFAADVVNYYRVQGPLIDTFNRTVSNDWGTTPTGQTWAVIGTASDYSVASSAGRHSVGSIDAFRTSVIELGASNQDVTAAASVPIGTPTGGALTQWVAVRYTDVDNYYSARTTVTTTGAVLLDLAKRVDGTLSGLGGIQVAASHTSGEVWSIRIQATGSTVRCKAWTTTEPPDWQVNVTDVSNTPPPGTKAALLSRVEVGNTDSLPVVTSWDSFVVTDPEITVFTADISPTLDTVWIKSVARPFLNRTVRVRDYSEFTRTSRNGTFDVVGRSFPIAVTDVRSSKRFTLEVYAEDAADARNLDLVLGSGDIMFLHVPSTGRLSTVPGGYVAVGDTSELVLPTADLNLRVFSLPCTIVAPPGPEVVGVTYTCQGVLNDYATCTDLLAAFATILDLLDNVGSAEDVIVP